MQPGAPDTVAAVETSFRFPLIVENATGRNVRTYHGNCTIIATTVSSRWLDRTKGTVKVDCSIISKQLHREESGATGISSFPRSDEETCFVLRGRNLCDK